jgi:hypothetical protein
LSGILKDTAFRKLLRSSDENVGRHLRYCVRYKQITFGPVIEASSSYWTQQIRCFPLFHLRTETNIDSEMLCTLKYRTVKVENSVTPKIYNHTAILSIIVKFVVAISL